MWKLAILLLLQAAVPAQREIVGPYTFREDQGQTTKIVLKNGLTVIVREEHAVPLASITTHVKAGYFDEEDRLNGISHVVEHMFFKGTAQRPVGEIARQTRALGGVLNGYTDYDRTVYYTVVPAANTLAALDIQADALLHPAFNPEELKREIEVVLQENNRKLDNPSALAVERLYETAFTEHRMKRWRLGTADGLRALTADDVTAYYQKYYRPSNIVLAVVGAFDREKILEGVVKLYASTENATVERDASPAEPAQEATRYASRRGPVQQAQVVMGFHAPGILTEDARTLEVLAAILGTGRSSRFNQVLRNEKSLITAGSAQLRGFRDMGYFQVQLETSSPLEAATAALAEVESIKRFGVSGEVVSRAKAAIAQSRLAGQETVDGIGDRLAYYEALRDWNLSSTYLADIQRVTPQRVMDAARKYLTTTNLGVFEYLPETIDRNLTAADYKTAVLDKVDAAVARRNEEELPVTAQIPLKTEGILVADMVGTIQRRSILRGPEVYILEDHRLPIVSFGIFFPGGRLLETPQNAGITELTLRSAMRGTRNFDSAQISRRLENAGARIEVVNEPDFFGYMLSGLAGRMNEAIQVLVEILQDPVFEEPEVVGERNQQLQRIRNLRDDNAAYPISLFMQSLYGTSSYARPAVGTEEGIGKLTAVDVRAWFVSNERKVLPTIVIVGDTRGTGLVAPIADALTNEDLETRDLATLPRQQASSQPGAGVETVSRQQTALVYGFPGVIRSANERYALDVLANVVSGTGGRFFEAIREKQGLAYTVRTANITNSRGGSVYTYAAFSPDKESEVRAVLDAEHARLRRDGITGEELRRAAESAVGARDASLQTRDARVLEYARAIYSGSGVQSVARYETAVRAVTAAQVKTVIDRVMDPAMLRIGVVRGRAQ
jgi:zinc protease